MTALRYGLCLGLGIAPVSKEIMSAAPSGAIMAWALAPEGIAGSSKMHLCNQF
jgi:hypothetical protein